eukprot:3940275-Rhodomonas_salina.2
MSGTELAYGATRRHRSRMRNLRYGWVPPRPTPKLHFFRTPLLGLCALLSNMPITLRAVRY